MEAGETDKRTEEGKEARLTSKLYNLDTNCTIASIRTSFVQ
jgi:hypothetical protein